MLNKNSCERNFVFIYNLQPAGLGATRAQLLRLLRSVDLVSWSTREESGRVDRRAFTRFATGSTAVFSKRQVSDAETSAVSILVDCSGSMSSNNRLRVAESVTIQLAKLLDKARVSFSIAGFRGAGSSDFNEIKQTGANSKQDYFKTQECQFIPFKTWGESIRKASAKLGSIESWACGSTPDYSALMLKIEELSRREEHKKILFVLTDAMGYDVDHIKHCQDFADKQKIKLIAIGIQSVEVTKCFKVSENITNVNDMAKASFNKLLGELA